MGDALAHSGRNLEGWVAVRWQTGRGMGKPGFPYFATRKNWQVGGRSQPGQMARERTGSPCYTHPMTPTGSARAAAPVAAARLPG